MTRAEAIAACVASSGWGAGACAESVDSQTVDGVYCDGTIVLDENGKRCIPRSVVERTRAARASAPLLSRPEDAPSAGRAALWVLVAIVGASALALYLAHE